MAGHPNLTFQEKSEKFSFQHTSSPRHILLAIHVVVASPVWFINVIGNALVIISIFRERKLHRPSYYLLAFLSHADICSPLFGFIPATCANFIKSPSVCSSTVQSVLMFPGYTASMTSFLLLIVLTAERHFSIAFPLLHRRKVGTRKICIIVSCTWAFSIGFYGTFAISRRDDSVVPVCAPYSSHFSFASSFLGFSGLVVLMSLNTHILLMLKKRSPSKEENPNDPPRYISKATKTVIVIVLFFVLCWLPVTVFLLLDAMARRIDLSQTTVELSHGMIVILSIVNGAINPLVYARQNPHFRAAFRKLLSRRHQIAVETTS